MICVHCKGRIEEGRPLVIEGLCHPCCNLIRSDAITSIANLSVWMAKLREAVPRLIEEREYWKGHAAESDRELCALQDALGCPPEMRNTLCSLCGAVGTSRNLPIGECPRLGCCGRIVDCGIGDAEKASLERVRDLIAAEGELGDLTEAARPVLDWWRRKLKGEIEDPDRAFDSIQSRLQAALENKEVA